MNTITDKLAAALRTCESRLTFLAQDSAKVIHELKVARESLAEYDAERAIERDPDTDAFLAAVRNGYGEHPTPEEDHPIDRVDDGAWVTVRVFVLNEDAGLAEGD